MYFVNQKFLVNDHYREKCREFVNIDVDELFKKMKFKP